MDAGQWSVVRSLFEEAVELEHPRRAEWLTEQAPDDPSVRNLVMDLLTWDDEEVTPLEWTLPGFLAEPVGDAVVPDLELGPWRLTEALGSGGMGTVYGAVRADGQYDRSVAIKLVNATVGSAELTRRFEAERRILATLDHPNVARMYDAGIASDGRPYLVMEQVSGHPVDRYCDEQRLGVRDRVHLFLQVCAAVDHAHKGFVIHRDLKPSNVLVSEGGAVKLLDFGIAKLLEQDGSDHRTGPATRLMTVEYASPEQVRGEVLTTASDVYALGVILHELLTGRRPHASATEAIAWAFAGKDRPDLPPPSRVEFGPVEAASRGTSVDRLRRDLAGDLDWVCLKALAGDPSRRYPSARALADDLDRFLAEQPITARPPSVGYRAGLFLRRHTVGVVAATLVLASVLAGSGLAVWQAREAERERDTAVAVSDFLEDLFRGADPLTDGVRDTTRIVDFLQVAHERTLRDLAERPAIRARLLVSLATAQGNLSRPDLAIPVLRDAVAAADEAHGGPHPDGIEALSLLGFHLGRTGAMDEGVTALQEALAQEVQLNGDRSAGAADLYEKMARVYLNARRTEEAEPWLRKSVEVLRDLDPPQWDRLVTSLNTLGSALGQRSLGAEAIPLLEEALSIGETHGFDESESSNLASEGQIRSNYAFLLARENRIGEAVEQSRIALSKLEQVFGPNDPNLANAEIRLGRLLTTLWEETEDDRLIPEADSLLAKGLATLRAAPTLPPGGLAITLNSYGNALRSWGRPEEALQLFEEAYAEEVRSFGEGSPGAMHNLSNRGRVLAELGRLDEADTDTRTALEAIRELMGESHLMTLNATLNRGRVLIATGELEAAVDLLGPAMDQSIEVLGEEHSVIGVFESLVEQASRASGSRD